MKKSSDGFEVRAISQWQPLRLYSHLVVRIAFEHSWTTNTPFQKYQHHIPQPLRLLPWAHLGEGHTHYQVLTLLGCGLSVELVHVHYVTGAEIFLMATGIPFSVAERYWSILRRCSTISAHTIFKAKDRQKRKSYLMNHCLRAGLQWNRVVTCSSKVYRSLQECSVPELNLDIQVNWYTVLWSGGTQKFMIHMCLKISLMDTLPELLNHSYRIINFFLPWQSIILVRLKSLSFRSWRTWNCRTPFQRIFFISYSSPSAVKE